MNLAAALLLGHLIADFPLQTNWIYQLKSQSWLGVLLHTTIHLVVTAALIQPIQRALPLLCVLGLLHFITDYTKVRVQGRHQSPGFLIDQGAHLLVIFWLANQWQHSLGAVLSTSLLWPLLLYASFLGILVFGWVLACDLAQSRWARHDYVQWARTNLLTFSQYAGIPLLFTAVTAWYRQHHS